jgi:spore coat polysaccharide biosynthesis predicted glycosyltransferase SpsG
MGRYRLDSEKKLKAQRRILIHVIANKKIGLGHVFNILTILPHFDQDEILIVMNKKNNLGNKKFINKSYKIKFFQNQKELFKIIHEFSPNIVFNDVLDTKPGYIKKLKKANCFIVNFEDLGEGSKFANLVFNPIYFKKSTSTKLFGEKYACVREEFRNKIPKLSKNSVVITFGGVDPNQLTLRLLKILEQHCPKYKIYIIIGNEFSHKAQILKTIRKLRLKKLNIEVVIKSDRISKFIDKSMFAITANGRTVFEVASRNVPLITISANSREENHKFSKIKKIGYHLGLHSKVSNKKILDNIIKMENQQNRKKFESQLKKMNLQNGVHNVVQIIEQRYNKVV